MKWKDFFSNHSITDEDEVDESLFHTDDESENSKNDSETDADADSISAMKELTKEMRELKEANRELALAGTGGEPEMAFDDAILSLVGYSDLVK